MTKEQLREFEKDLVKTGLENVQNIVLIKNGATNGEVIKTTFDTTEEHFYDKDKMVDVYGLDRSDDPLTFYSDWWNASYERW